MGFPVAIIGVLINLTGGLSTAFGWAIQKYAHNEANKASSSYYSNIKWWIGLLLVIAAQPLYIFSSAFANQSTLGVVGPFSLIASLLFARLLLNEKISCWEYCGIMLFIPGIVLTLLFASMENNRLNQDQFNKVFYSQIPMAYLGINFLIVIIMSVISYNTFKILESNDQQIKHPENEDSETTRNYLTFENEYHSHKREGSEERLNKKSKEEPKSKLEKSRNSSKKLF